MNIIQKKDIDKLIIDYIIDINHIYNLIYTPMNRMNQFPFQNLYLFQIGFLY
jgi:hypothetical protein